MAGQGDDYQAAGVIITREYIAQDLTTGGVAIPIAAQYVLMEVTVSKI